MVRIGILPILLPVSFLACQSPSVQSCISGSLLGLYKRRNGVDYNWLGDQSELGTNLSKTDDYLRNTSCNCCC